MQKTRKRILTFTLALAMVFGLFTGLPPSVGAGGSMGLVAFATDCTCTHCLSCDCPALHDGAFADEGGISGWGASWRLYECGVLIVGGGHIGSSRNYHPWHNGSPQFPAPHPLVQSVSRIVFTAPITVYETAWNLFASTFPLVIEGLEHFDVSEETDMTMMFYSGQSPWSNPDISMEIHGISAWDTGNVTTMRAMFSNGRISELENLSSWDVSNVTDMVGMFSSSRITELNLSGWDVSGVSGSGV